MDAHWLHPRNTAASLDDLPAAIIHGHRFMDKALMAAARDALPVGGLFIWATFLQVCLWILALLCALLYVCKGAGVNWRD
jgi:hypothetical protein